MYMETNGEKINVIKSDQTGISRKDGPLRSGCQVGCLGAGVAESRPGVGGVAGGRKRARWSS